MSDVTISNSLSAFKTALFKQKKSENTIKVYCNALESFEISLKKSGINPEVAPATIVSPELFKRFVDFIDHLSPRTYNLYVQAVKLWFIFLSENYNPFIDLRKIKEIINSTRKIARNNIKVDFSEVQEIIGYLMNEKELEKRNGQERLRFLRDRAIILILSDTGIDLETVRDLTCQDVDLRKSIITLENCEPEKAINLSIRASESIRLYLNERASYFPSHSKSKDSSPLFIRHDKGTGKKEQTVTTTTIRNIVKERAGEIFKIDSSNIKVSPMWFRHFYEKNLTRSLQTMLHPKIVDRCLRLYENGHYQDAVFSAMKVVEIEIRKKLPSSDKLYGVDLVGFAFGGENPKLLLRPDKKEHDAARGLFMGAVTLMRNPLGHKFLDDTDQVSAHECLIFASLLMRMLDKASLSI